MRISGEGGIRQRGQAMTEFVLTACFILVGMVIMMQGLSAIFDMQNSVHQVSRYVSWERVVGRQAVPESEIRSRFYKDPLNGMSVIIDKINPLWNASHPFFVADGEELALYSGTEASSGLVRDSNYQPAPAPDISNAADWMTQHNSMLNLEESSVGYVESNLSYQARLIRIGNSNLSNGKGWHSDNHYTTPVGNLRSRGGIITDNWTPKDEEQLRQRVSGAVPLDNETLDDITPMTGYIPVIGDISSDVSILKGVESGLIVRDDPAYEDVFDYLMPELGSAAAGDYNMTNEDLSVLVPN